MSSFSKNACPSIIFSYVILNKSKLAYRIYVILIANKEFKKIMVMVYRKRKLLRFQGNVVEFIHV
jgi:hypothetical protein